MKNMNVRKISALAVFLALAVVLSYVESFIPFWIPGVKLGLANLVILILLYGFEWYDAFLVDLLRVFVASLLRGNIGQMGFYMSLAGAMLSFVGMLLAKMFFKKLTIYGVSIFGAFLHSLAQVLVGVLFLSNWGVFYYFPFISLISMATGLVNALIAERILRSGAINRIGGHYEKEPSKPVIQKPENETND